MSRSCNKDTFWKNMDNVYGVTGDWWKRGNSVVREEFPRIPCNIFKLLDISV
jgi:hypothetical protein